MRHFSGIEFIKDNEKPRQEKARRAARRFVTLIKRGLILGATAAMLAALLSGCGQPRRGDNYWPSIHGHGCELAAGCDRETGYHYGVNDCCYPPAMLTACEAALDHNDRNAPAICGQ